MVIIPSPATVIISFSPDHIFLIFLRGEGGDKPRPYERNGRMVVYVDLIANKI
jgi:hypothetical protein